MFELQRAAGGEEGRGGNSRVRFRPAKEYLGRGGRMEQDKNRSAGPAGEGRGYLKREHDRASTGSKPCNCTAETAWCAGGLRNCGASGREGRAWQ